MLFTSNPNSTPFVSQTPFRRTFVLVIPCLQIPPSPREYQASKRHRHQNAALNLPSEDPSAPPSGPSKARDGSGHALTTTAALIVELLLLIPLRRFHELLQRRKSPPKFCSIPIMGRWRRTQRLPSGSNSADGPIGRESRNVRRNGLCREKRNPV